MTDDFVGIPKEAITGGAKGSAEPIVAEATPAINTTSREGLLPQLEVQSQAAQPAAQTVGTGQGKDTGIER